MKNTKIILFTISVSLLAILTTLTFKFGLDALAAQDPAQLAMRLSQFRFPKLIALRLDNQTFMAKLSKAPAEQSNRLDILLNEKYKNTHRRLTDYYQTKNNDFEFTLIDEQNQGLLLVMFSNNQILSTEQIINLETDRLKLAYGELKFMSQPILKIADEENQMASAEIPQIVD